MWETVYNTLDVVIYFGHKTPGTTNVSSLPFATYGPMDLNPLSTLNEVYIRTSGTNHPIFYIRLVFNLTSPPPLTHSP